MNRFKRYPLFASFFLVLFIVGCNTITNEVLSGKDLSLSFNDNKTFKIAQFTDIHWKNENKEECAKTEALIRHVLATEQPDLAVLTGDIVNHPAEDGWKSVMSFFTDAGVKFAVTMGNHDHESDWSNSQIFDYLETLPGFVGEKGPEDISGVGNYIISLNSAKTDSTAALLYFFDSNAYCEDKSLSDYDWIKHDQIVWYREQSQQYTSMNGNEPYPALAFFHIPLPEYSEVLGQATTLGESDERICSPYINTGMFASMIEMKDVMGTFVGHDHNNNYIGIYGGIALAYGQSSGYGGYGEMKGSRIIELHEGKHEFNTWVRTEEGISLEYNFPFGYSFTTDNEVYLPAKKVENAEKGIQYNYYEGDFVSVSELSSAKVIKSGIVDDFTLEVADSKTHFGLEFNGLIKIPLSAKYRFFAFSDDGSQLYINDELVVDNDGKHGALKQDALIALEEGYHDFKVLYFQHTGGSKLEIRYSSLDFMETLLPESILFHVKN
ncbi:MAG TPA: PA14 domain-containing protein [Dysgonamonadaceae bacterium]|nr:PA14 domain-containing protein [Dysgonamonadaceae bacterium]